MRVFLSYAEEDRLWARQLSSHLKRAGLDILDPREATFPGDNPYLAFAKALNRANALVFLLSTALARSDRIGAELQYALGGTKFKGRVSAVARSRSQAKQAPWIIRRIHGLVVTRNPALAARRLTEQFLGVRKGRIRRVHAAS